MTAGFEIDATAGAAEGGPESIDWLVYHPRQIYRQGDRVVERDGPILDDLAYNQNESRALVDVPDVILNCLLQATGAGRVYLRISDGRKEFVVTLDLAARRGEVLAADAVAARFDLPGWLTFERPCAVALALADCRLQLIVADQLVADHRYDPAEAPPRQPTAAPVAIGAAGTQLRVAHWVVSRDVYYLPPPGTAAIAERQLGPGEYWLLGDNSAVSDDSRTWPGDVRVTRDALVGRVLRRSPAAGP